MAAAALLMSASGTEIPLLGLGTWKSKPDEVKNAVSAAIKAGYRHIDAAAVYGNEKEVGQGIKIGLEESGLAREDLFVTSKLWNTCHGKEQVAPALERTLSDLGLEYLDLYLIHWPTDFVFVSESVLMPKDDDGKVRYSAVPFSETWSEMEKLVDSGKVRAIGLSNFNAAQCKQVLEGARIKPANLQIEVHAWLPQDQLIAAVQDMGMTVTAYSPLGSADRPWATSDSPKLLDEKALADIGSRYDKSPAQVLLRWLVERGIVVIPKSANPQRIQQNAAIFDFKLSADDHAILRAMDKGKAGRMCVPRTVLADGSVVPRDRDHPQFPFADEF